ncbi:hypothetical protein D3C80_1538000 [compost metagenome]
MNDLRETIDRILIGVVEPVDEHHHTPRFRQAVLKPLTRTSFGIDRFDLNCGKILERIGGQLLWPLNFADLAVLFRRDGDHDLSQADVLIAFAGK